MRLLEEYTRRAKECRELAAKTDSPEQRKTILGISETWAKMAAQRLAHMNDAKRKPDR